MSASVVILLNLFVLSLAPPVVDQEPSTATSSEDGTGNHHGGQPQPGWWHYHGQQGGFGGMPSSGGMPGYGGPQLGFWNRPQPRPGYWGQPLAQPWAQPHVVNNPPVQDGSSDADEAASPGYGAGFTQDRVGGPWSFAQGNIGAPGMMAGMSLGMTPLGMGMMPTGMGMTPPAMGMMPQGMGMTPPGMGMTPPGIGMGPGMTPASMVPGMNMGMAPGMGFGMSMMPGMNTGMTQPMGMGLGMGMGSGMGMMPQAFGGMGMGGLGSMGMLGLMNFFGGSEDLMEDTRDQNSDDLGADEHLTSSKARLEKYLQKQWQLGKRKLQVQVDFGNVPLEWKYLNQYHGVRHPLAMTAFGPKYGLAGPPPPMYDYGYGPVQQGGLPMPSPFFGQQAPGSWQQQQFGPAPVQQPEASVQGEETVQQPATSR